MEEERMEVDSKKRKHGDNEEEQRHESQTRDDDENERPRESKRQRNEDGGDDADLSAKADDDDAQLDRAQQKGKKKARAPTGRFKQEFREDAEFGSTDFRDKERLEGEEEAEGEASLMDLGGYKVKGVGKVEFEPFNMKEEREEGYIDAKGHYVYKTRDEKEKERQGLGAAGESEEEDEDAKGVDEQQADAWLQDIATLATTKKVTFAPEVVDNEKVVEKVDLLELKREACKHLLPGETVSKALIRLGNSMRAQRKAAGRGRGKVKGKQQPPKTGEKESEKEGAGGQGEQGTEELTDTRRFELLTEAASKLMDEGWTNIYHNTLEQLKKIIKHEERKRSTGGQEGEGGGGEAVGEQQMWEYKTGSSEEQVFGPFPTAAMEEWKSKGYLAGAVVRKKGEEGTSFVEVDGVSFS